MNFQRLAVRIFILLLVLSFICCGKVVTVVDKPVESSAVSAKITQKKGKTPEVKLAQVKGSEIKRPEEKPPAVKPADVKQPAIKPKEAKKSPFALTAGLPERNTIGCVLPLSGRYEDYGNKALDAILLAAGMFDENNKTPWKIIAVDSRGAPEGLKNAVSRLAAEDNVMAIIAVAGTAEAAAAAREAEKRSVPIILITAKEGIANGSSYVFQHFLTPSQQIKALVDYAVNNLNRTTFSVLYPKDDYGVEMLKLFRTETDREGGEVDRAISYNKTQTDFTEEINKLTNKGIKSAKKINTNKSEKKVKAAADFETLFIPDSYQRIKMITAQLVFYDVKGFKLLGTSLWNSPDLLKSDSENLEGAVFVDSFLVNGFYPETNDFVDAYYTAYGREPENMEALAYDTMGMVMSVLNDQYVQSRRQFIAGLQQLENYKGVTGNTSFSGDRVAKKTAFILQVRNGKLEQVK